MTKPRTASGQFAAIRAPKVRTAGERLVEVRAELKRIEFDRDSVMSARRSCLLADDDAGRRRCDFQLRELSDDLQAAHDKAELLGRAAPAQELSRKTMPTDLPSVLAALQALEPRLVQLASVPWQALDAGRQAELDSLRQRQYYLTGLAGRMRPAQETKAS